LGSTIRPERKQFDTLGINEHAVIQEVPDSRDVDATYVFKFDIGRSICAVGCNPDDAKDSLKFFANRMGRASAVPPPPGFEFADVLSCKTADLDR
jgi:hypothetical protein